MRKDDRVARLLCFGKMKAQLGDIEGNERLELLNCAWIKKWSQAAAADLVRLTRTSMLDVL